MKYIRSIFLLICAAVVVLLSFTFYSRRSVIEVKMPLLTREMVNDRQEDLKKEEKQRQNVKIARMQAAKEEKLILCETDDDCVIVDKDPCGCLKGPEGVTAINSTMALEFSRLMEPLYAKATACASESSTEKECSPSARAVCEQKKCKIIY